MRFRDIPSLAVLFIIAIFMFVKLGGTGRIIGLVLIALCVVLLLVTLKDNGIIKKRVKKSEKRKREAEIIKYNEEITELEKYDIDSGLEYCAHCGNYSVKEGSCEVCGEKVTE